MAKRLAGIVMFLTIVGSAIVGSKKSDPDTLATVGQVVARKVHAALPEASKVAGPLAAFKPGDALTVEERVRTRIRTDKKMGGADVAVTPGPTPGEVHLRGVVQSQVQARRAVELAEGTTGVEKVVNELAVPE